MGKRLRDKWIMISLLAVMTPAVADAVDTSPTESMPEVTIPFANHGGIRDWKVVDDSTLLIQDVHGHWYLAKLQSAAYDLAFADGLIFGTPPSDELGKLSTVVVRGQRYPIVSLTRTEPPPKTRTDAPPRKFNPY